MPKNSLFRDNIRDNRLIAVDEKVTAIIDTPIFQRLRDIQQTGLCSYVFPTTQHSRFAHSIGVYATARETFLTLQSRAADLALKLAPISFDKHAADAFAIAALCHDIGHTAFSHALENSLLPYPFSRHEQSTLALLHGNDTLRKAISRHTDLQEVVLYLEGNHPNKALSSLISGSFDIDRCDYLERDCAQTGVRYGAYDFNWLQYSMSIMRNSRGLPELLMDGPKALDALTQFLYARQQMYKHVYFHHAVRSAQSLLRIIMQRIPEIGLPRALISASPKGLRNLIKGNHNTQDDLEVTTDAEIKYFIRLIAQDSTNPVLKDLCSRFVIRDFPKYVLNSEKLLGPINDYYKISTDDGGEFPTFSFIGKNIYIETLILELIDLASNHFRRKGFSDKDSSILASSLVFVDAPQFNADIPSDLTLRFINKDVTLERYLKDYGNQSFDDIVGNFNILRIYGPRDCRKELQDHVNKHIYGVLL